MNTNEETGKIIQSIRDMLFFDHGLSGPQAREIATSLTGELQSKFKIIPLCCNKCEWAKTDCVCDTLTPIKTETK